MSNRTERAVGRKLLPNSGSKGAKAHKGAASATNATQKNRTGSVPQRNASTSAVEQIAAAEHENDNNDIQLISICKQLGFDRRTRTELVNTYNELNASFALEGDSLGWFAAVVYIAVKRASLNGESPPFSVTRLLQIAKITLSELFRKVRKTCELSRADEAVRGAVDRAESVFAVSSVLFRRFDQLMRAVFAIRGPTSTSTHLALLRGDADGPESESEDSKPPRATGELIYAFGWLLFLFARTQFELVADDLVSSFMLLLCCVDATFRNTLQLADESCFNETFLAQFFTPAQRVALFESRDASEELELIAFACSRFAFGAHELDVRTVRCHFFDALLRAALSNVDGRGAFLQGDADSLGDLLRPAHMQHNFCALSAYCDEHVLRACDVDERVFINERPPDAVDESPCGTPYRDLLGLPTTYELPRLASPPSPPAPEPDSIGAACDAHQQAFAALRSVILIGGLRDAAQRVQTRFPSRADALERRVRNFTSTFLAWSQPQHDAPPPVSVDCARFIVQVATGVYWNVLESLLIEEEEQFRAAARRRHEAIARAGRKRPAVRGRPKERLRDPEGRAEPHQNSAVHLNAVARRRARERVELRLRRLLNDLIAVDEMHRGVFVIALDLVLFLYGLASSRRERLFTARRAAETQKDPDEAESDVRDADRERLETLLALFGASAFGVSKLLVCVARCGCVASLPRAATTHLARVDELLVEELVLRDPSPFWRALHAYERALRDSDEPNTASATPTAAPASEQTHQTRTFELPGPDELCVVDPVRAHARQHTLTGNVSVSLGGGSGTRRRRTLAPPSLGVLTSSSCFRADDEPNAQRLASLAGVYLSPLNRLVSLRERERALERSRRGESLTSSAKRRLFAADDRPNPADGDADGDSKRISRSLFAEADLARSPSSRSPGVTPQHGSPGPVRPGANAPRPPFGSPQRTLSASPVRSVPLGMPLRGTSNPSQPVPVPTPGGSPLAVLSPRRVPAGQRISRVAAPPRLVDPSTAPTIRVQNSSAALAALRPAPRYPYAPNANVFETPPQMPFALPAGSPSKSAADSDQSRMSSLTPTKPTPAITVTSPITHANAQVNTTASARPGASTSIVCSSSSTSPSAAESEAAPPPPSQQQSVVKVGPSTNGNVTTATLQPSASASAPRSTGNPMCASQSVSIIVASSTVAVARPSASRIVLAPSTTSTVVCSSAAVSTCSSATAATTNAAATSTTSVVKVGARFVPRGSPLSVVRAPAPPRGTAPAPAATTTISASASASQPMGQNQPQTTRMPVVSVTSVRMPAASRNLFAISRYPRPLGLAYPAQGRPSPTAATTQKTTASASNAPVTNTVTVSASPPKSSNVTDAEDVEVLVTSNSLNSGETQQNGDAKKRPVEAVDGTGVAKRRRTDEEIRRRRPPCGASLRQFVRRIYLLASDRLRRLCATLGTPEELIVQIWTVFVHCVRDVALLRAILRGRHLDQALLCCVYATWFARLQRERLAARRVQLLNSAASESSPGAADTSEQVIDSLFTQRIIREYRKMPHARSETYRRVRLLRIGSASDDDDTNSDSDTADSAYEYGDLIVFYNDLFRPLVNSFVLQLVTQSTGKLTGEQLVALNVAPPSTTRAESPSGPDADGHRPVSVSVSMSMLVRGLLSPLPALRYNVTLQPAALLPTRVSPRFYASFKLPAPPAAPGGALSLSVPAKSVGARSVAAAAALEASGSPAKLLLHRLKKRHDKPKQHDWTILLRSLRRQYPSTDRQQRLFYVTDVSPLRELHTINVALRHAAPNTNTRPLSFLVTPNPSAERSDPASNSNPGSEAQERPVSNLDRLVEAAFSVSRADSITDVPCKSEPAAESATDKADALRRSDEPCVKTEPMDESERPLAPAPANVTTAVAVTSALGQAEQPAEPRRGRPPKHVDAATQPSGSSSEKPGAAGALRPSTRASLNKARPSK